VLRFLFILSLHGHAMSSVGLLLSASIAQPVVACMLCPLTVVPFMLTSGFFLNSTSLPAHLQWLAALSPHRHAFAAAMSAEFDAHMLLHCDEAEHTRVLLRADSAAPETFTVGSMVRGQQVLDLLALPYECFAQSSAALLLLCGGFRLAAFAALQMQIRGRRLKLQRVRRQIGRAALRGWQQLTSKAASTGAASPRVTKHSEQEQQQALSKHAASLPARA
jgi:hypothetical protein